MKNYMLNVKFCAGSDESTDVDTGLYLMETDKDLSKSDVEEVFGTVNGYLSVSVDDEGYSDTPIESCYAEMGLNIHTLIQGVQEYSKAKIIPVKDNCGNINIENYFDIEQQW